MSELLVQSHSWGLETVCRSTLKIWATVSMQMYQRCCINHSLCQLRLLSKNIFQTPYLWQCYLRQSMLLEYSHPKGIFVCPTQPMLPVLYPWHMLRPLHNPITEQTHYDLCCKNMSHIKNWAPNMIGRLDCGHYLMCPECGHAEPFVCVPYFDRCVRGSRYY